MKKEIVLGLATMDAGLAMPGASFQNLMRTRAHYDRVIAVDGALTEEGKKIYKEYDVEYIDSPWVGSLKIQYEKLLAKLNTGDLWVMLDDDEYPSESLLRLLPTLLHDTRYSYFSSPRVTAFSEDGKTFYFGEEIPTRKNPQGPGIAGPRVHIYRITPDLQMLASKAGRHVVPYYADRPPANIVGDGDIFHAHFKAPEMYVYNNCVKALFDNDIQNPQIEQEYRQMMASNNIVDGKTFVDITTSGKVNQQFIDFCMKYRGAGAPEGRLFVWYYNICHPNLNPHPEMDWTYNLRIVLNDNWRNIFLKNKKEQNSIEVDLTPFPKGIGKITI